MRNAKFARAIFVYWPILGGLGAILWLSWAILGAFWGHLGLSWGHLGAILGLPGATLPLLYLADLSQDLKNLCFVDAKCLLLESSVRCVQSYLWSILGAILGYLAATSEPSWAILGPSWAHLGPSWGNLGRVYANLH